MKPRVLILNAALSGEVGNTAVLLSRAAAALAESAVVTTTTLHDTTTFAEIEALLNQADALVVGTGTYWDSWSHRLQRLLEQATVSEGKSLWLGKPVGVVVTMHSVGGKGVLSRLQGVLNTFGCVIPPMSGIVYSLVNQAALETERLGTPDMWSPEDVDIICHNLLEALKPRPGYRAWPVDRGDPATRWLRS